MNWRLLLSILGPLAEKLMKSAAAAPVAVETAPVAEPAPALQSEIATANAIDWQDPKAKVSKYFTVRDAVYLPSWDCYHQPTDAEKLAIVRMAAKMDAIREFLAQPIQVHVWLRPAKASIPGSKWDGCDYNRYVYETFVWNQLPPQKMALMKTPRSAHLTAEGVDWSVVGRRTAKDCAAIRKLLLPELERLGVRMEANQGAWIHIDVKPVVRDRFFKD